MGTENSNMKELYDLYLLDTLLIDFEDAIDSELLDFDGFCNHISEYLE